MYDLQSYSCKNLSINFVFRSGGCKGGEKMSKIKQYLVDTYGEDVTPEDLEVTDERR